MTITIKEKRFINLIRLLLNTEIYQIKVKKMVKINPYLMVKNGRDAIELYKDLFGAKLVDHTPFAKETGDYLGFPEDFDYENFIDQKI